MLPRGTRAHRLIRQPLHKWGAGVFLALYRPEAQCPRWTSVAVTSAEAAAHNSGSVVWGCWGVGVLGCWAPHRALHKMTGPWGKAGCSFQSTFLIRLRDSLCRGEGGQEPAVRRPQALHAKFGAN
jgi:hypothetical protein